MAAVLRAAPNVSDSQASDIARRVISADQPEVAPDGSVRLASGEALNDALARHAQAAPHLFTAPEGSPQHTASVAKRAKLAALPAAARLEAANGGVSAAWAREFRKEGA